MLSEISDLFAGLPPSALRTEYTSAIVDDNILGKPTASTRRLTDQRLGELYALDPRLPILRVLRRLWNVDPAGRPLVALLCALGRDPLLRSTAATILSLGPGEELVRTTFVAAIRETTRDRLNESILDKVARNTASSWTQSGHLQGRVRKTRQRVASTPGSVAFALWLGSLQDMSGEELLSTAWTKVFDAGPRALVDDVLGAKQLRLLQARVGGAVIDIDPTSLDPGVAGRLQ